MMWWIILFCIIVPLMFVGVVKKAQADFNCLNCGKSITIRHYSKKQVTCNRCGIAHYTLFAWGSEVQRVEYHIMAHDDKDAVEGIIRPELLTRSVDITEVEED